MTEKPEPRKEIDEEWKQKVKKEKEETTRQEKGKEGEPRASERAIPLRPPDFKALVANITTQILVALGAIETPDGKQPEIDLGLAKYWIDLLHILEEKTRGNLDEDEKYFLSNTLHELRILYLQVKENLDKET